MVRKVYAATAVVDLSLVLVIVGWLCFAAAIVPAGASPAAAILMVIARVLP